LDLSYLEYLNAKNPPTIKPGREMTNMEPPPTAKAKSTPSTPDASEAIIIIRSADFAAAKSK